MAMTMEQYRFDRDVMVHECSRDGWGHELELSIRERDADWFEYLDEPTTLAERRGVVFGAFVG